MGCRQSCQPRASLKSRGVRHDADIFSIIETDADDCAHQYLLKREDIYFCAECEHKLSLETDLLRIVRERDQEIYNSDSVQCCVGLNCFCSPEELSRGRGVSIGYLLDFTNAHYCWDWTTHQVIAKIILPATKAKRCRYIDIDNMKNEHVGPAKTFVSYAHAAPWGNMVAALCDGGASMNRKVWIDVFANRLWSSNTPEQSTLNVIEHCESFMLVCFNGQSGQDTANCQSEDRIKTSLFRLKCLTEVAIAARKKGMPLIVKYGSYILNSDGSVVFESKENLLGFYPKIDIAKAETRLTSEKAYVLSDLYNRLGVVDVNQILKRVLAGAHGHSFIETSSWKMIVASIQCAACGDEGALNTVIMSGTDSVIASAAGGYTLLMETLLNYFRGSITKFDILKALMWASVGGQLGCVEVLIANGADINAKDTDGMTALDYASLGDHRTVMEILKKYGAISAATTS
jgi:hypothetical protein